MMCLACDGRGICAYVQKKTDSFPEAKVCKRCKGRGSFTLNELAQLLDVDASGIYRVNHLKPSRIVGARLLKRLAAVFPEALGE
jgi:hypothetical protein